MLTFPPPHALSPMIPNNACHLCITAAAGTELAVTSFGLDQTPLRGPFIPLTVVYIPKDFLPHAASLGQAFAHCPIFVTAALRGGPGSVSVPMRRADLSVPLPVTALVGRYLTKQLIGDRPLSGRGIFG